MIGVDRIEGVLPHRFPMLLVDRVLDLRLGESITATKAVTCNEPWYRDVQDGAGTGYPEVLLIESWCQAAGVLAAWDRPNPDVLAGQVMLFGSMSDIYFHEPVLPGELVEHHVRVVRVLSDTMIFEGESVVGSRRVLDVGRVVMALRPAAELHADSLPVDAQLTAEPEHGNPHIVMSTN